MQTSTSDILTEIETRLQEEFPDVKMEFATQTFTKHAELWIYVLTFGEYKRVRDACRRLTKELALEQREPEIWLIAKAWTGPWPGGESEQELKRRRDEFKQKHGLTIATSASS